MAVTLTISNANEFNQTNQPGVITYYGTVVASGTYAAGGNTLAMNVANFRSSKAPVWVNITGRAAAYRYIWVPATTPTVASPGTIKVIDYTAAPAAELADGAYPAAVADDVITVQIIAPNR